MKRRTPGCQRAERRREKPAAPEAPPTASIQPRTDSVDEPQLEVSVPTAPVEMGLEMDVQGLGLTAADGEYLPIVKIAPVYPAGAQARGIEGWCLVEFTVTTTGTTRDVKVVDADPKSIFNKTSINAALKFKYRPRVVDGEAVEVPGVRNLFRYELER